MDLHEPQIIEKVLEVPLINELGDFKVGAYKLQYPNRTLEEIIVLYYNHISEINNVRVNSACYTGDLFHCNRCDCNEQMMHSLEYFITSGNGILLYMLNHDGRGQGTVNKLKTLRQMDINKCSTHDAFLKEGLEPDIRDYSGAVAILKDLGITNINLITNNPYKIEFFKEKGLNILTCIPSISQRQELRDYLISKQVDFRHNITFED